MWKERDSPLRIDKRFEFDNYQRISQFMEQIDNLCKVNDVYPNISFGKNFVSITIFFQNKTISNDEKNLSQSIDQCFNEI